MKLMLLAKRFSRDGSSKWLVDELAEQFIAKGWDVQVILFDLKGDWEAGQHELESRLSVFSVPLSDRGKSAGIRKYVAFLGSWFRAITHIRKQDFGRFDLIINFSIASIFFGIVQRFMKTNLSAKSVLILWDFFPIHQYEIGKIRSRLLCKLLYWMENKEISSYHYVALMSERNIEYFRRYHRNYTGTTFKLPIWGKVEPACKVSASNVGELVPDKFKVVFGGQLAKGRGIPQLLDFVRQYPDQLQDVKLLIIGDGELTSYVERRVAEERLQQVLLLPRMDRGSYLELIHGCQAGLVVTVPGVSVPTFPSKLIDYMKACLPVLASVESTTDFGHYIQEVAKCGLASEAGDNQALLKNLLRLKTDPESCRRMGENGYAYFRKNHSVDKVVERLIAQIGFSGSEN